MQSHDRSMAMLLPAPLPLSAPPRLMEKDQGGVDQICLSLLVTLQADFWAKFLYPPVQKSRGRQTDRGHQSSLRWGISPVLRAQPGPSFPALSQPLATTAGLKGCYTICCKGEEADHMRRRAPIAQGGGLPTARGNFSRLMPQVGREIRAAIDVVSSSRVTQTASSHAQPWKPQRLTRLVFCSYR